MNISGTPIQAQRTLLRREPGGKFKPNLPEPTTPEEAKLFQETRQRAEQADKFLSRYNEHFVKIRGKDNTEEDLNSAPGVVATSDRFLRVTSSTVLKFDPSTQQVSSFENRENGFLYEKAGNPWREDLQQTASTTYISSPLSLSTDNLWVVVDDTSRSSRYQESLRAVGGDIFEYMTLESDALEPAG